MRPPRKKNNPPPAQTQQTSTEAVLSIEKWQGPLPAPHTLEEFERILPGSAKAIVAEWEAEAAHRRKYERRALSFQGLEQIGGRLLGFIFAVVALGVTVYLAEIGAEWTASIVGAGTIGSVVLALISGRAK